MKNLKISWSDCFAIIQKMIVEIENKYMDYKILAISRGGLIPATMISHQTNQTIDVINVFSYTNINRQGDVIIKPFSAYDKEIPKKILIVDDLIDSGNTLFEVWKYIAKKILINNLNIHDFSIKSVVMIDKCESIIKPSFCSTQMDESSWITFPYEKS